MSARRPGPLRAMRHSVVDTGLMRPDPWPEVVFGGMGALLTLLIAAWLFGSFPGVGARGPVEVIQVAEPEIQPTTDVEKAVDSRKTDAENPTRVQSIPPKLQNVARALNSGQVLPQIEGWTDPGIGRDWLDSKVCSPITTRSRAERSSLVYYATSQEGLCQGMNRQLILAPMTPVIGPVASMIVSLVILTALAFGLFVAARFLRRVRLAYRRLYVSEHRADHLEDGG